MANMSKTRNYRAPVRYSDLRIVSAAAAVRRTTVAGVCGLLPLAVATGFALSLLLAFF